MVAPLKPDFIDIGFFIDEDVAIPELRMVLAESIENAIDSVIANFQSLIVDQLIYGGKGWKAIIETSSWRWINSPKGYGQLGFSSPTEPLKLLNALRYSWSAKKVVHINAASESVYIGINFKFAELDKLRKATIHPAAGHGKLPANQSWFDWVYSGIAMQEEGFHFRKTGPAKGSRSSAIAGADAGLMKPGGLWQVTPRFRLDLDKLIDQNADKINNTIQNWMQDSMAEESRG